MCLGSQGSEETLTTHCNLRKTEETSRFTSSETGSEICISAPGNELQFFFLRRPKELAVLFGTCEKYTEKINIANKIQFKMQTPSKLRRCSETYVQI